jgi:membrane fusion protein (multidrug efflux system)
VVAKDPKEKARQIRFLQYRGFDFDVDLHNTDGPLLAETAPHQPRYQTDVYGQQLAGIDAIIKKIIADNDTQSSSSHMKG